MTQFVPTTKGPLSRQTSRDPQDTDGDGDIDVGEVGNFAAEVADTATGGVGEVIWEVASSFCLIQ